VTGLQTVSSAPAPSTGCVQEVEHGIQQNRRAYFNSTQTFSVQDLTPSHLPRQQPVAHLLPSSSAARGMDVVRWSMLASVFQLMRSSRTRFQPEEVVAGCVERPLQCWALPSCATARNDDYEHGAFTGPDTCFKRHLQQRDCRPYNHTDSILLTRPARSIRLLAPSLKARSRAHACMCICQSAWVRSVREASS
jgi:hypothetical protein